jgi:hypothetical protein
MCPCSCCNSFFFIVKCFVLVDANLHIFVLSAYICIVSVYPDIKIRRVGIPLTGLTPPYSHDYPKAGSGFPTQYVAVCVYSIGTG